MNDDKVYRAKLIHSKHGWLKVGMTFLAGVALATAGSVTNHTVHAAVATAWTARTSDQIDASVKAMQAGQYHIVWGDTLSGITAALQKAGYQTTMARIVEINKIANENLIYAGDYLTITGNKADAVITTQNAAGQVTGQYNANPQKPIVASNQDVQQAQKQTAASSTTTQAAAASTTASVKSGSQAASASTPAKLTSTAETAGRATITKPATTQVQATSTQGQTPATKATVTQTANSETTVTTGTPTGGNTQITDEHAGQTSGSTANQTTSQTTGNAPDQTTDSTANNSTSQTAANDQSTTAKTGTYIIKYYGKLGKVLAEETHTATIGDTLTLTATRTFAGYLLPVQPTQTQTFTHDGQVFNIDYQLDPSTLPSTTSRIVIRAVDEAGNQITTDQVLKLEAGSPYTATAPTVTGYTLSDSTTTQAVDTRSDGVVTFHYTKQTSAPKTATITINSVDENGNQIAAPTTKAVTVGDQVSISAPTVAGYTLKSDAIQSLKVNGDQSVNFTYTKIVDHTALDAAIAKAKTFSADQYTQTSFAKLTATLQTAEATDTNSATTQGQLDTATDNLNTAIKGLIKPVATHTITIKSVDQNGNILATTTATAPQGSTYTTTAQAISGYTLSGDQTQAVTVNGDMTLTFTYTKNQVAATYQAIVKDESGKQIAAGATVSGKVAGDLVTIKAPSIDPDQYTLANDSKTQTLVAGQNIIVFTATTKTTVVKADANYVVTAWDANGAWLADGDYQTGLHEGDVVTIKAPVIKGYKLAENQATTFTLTAGENDLNLSYVLDESQADELRESVRQDVYDEINLIRAAAQTNTDNTLHLADGSTITSAYTTPAEAKNSLGGQLTVDPRLQSSAQEHADDNAKRLGTGEIDSITHTWSDSDDPYSTNHQMRKLVQQGMYVEEDIVGAYVAGIDQKVVANSVALFITGDTGHNNSILNGLAKTFGVGVSEYQDATGTEQYVIVVELAE